MADLATRVYLAASGVPSLSQKEIAALLYAGQDSLITGPVALAYYSIRSVPFGDLIDVLVPARRQRLSTGLARLPYPAPCSLLIQFPPRIRHWHHFAPTSLTGKGS